MFPKYDLEKQHWILDKMITLFFKLQETEVIEKKITKTLYLVRFL